MSLTDLILENPLILVSMGAALLVFAAAGVLLLISVLRPILAERQRQQTLRREALLLAQAEEEDDALEDTMPAPPVTWNKTPQGPATAQAGTDEVQASEDSEDEKDEEVSEEMQSILSSVFAEEGETHRYAVLLRDQDIPSGQELAALSQNLAARLAKTRGGQGKQRTS